VLGRSGRDWVIRLRYPPGIAPFRILPQADTTPPSREECDIQPAVLPGGTLFRIGVAREGVYHITYEELVEAGLEPGELSDPDRIGLWNNGGPVPLRVIGDEDGVFATGDALEFWGEEPLCLLSNAGADLRRDPFAPWNIYYLYDGTTPPLRMIEESGEVVEVDPLSYYPLEYFTTTSRFEEDNYFDRLVVADSELELDHLFFDSGTRALETSQYQFALPGIWNGSPRPAQIRAGLRGQSFSTEANPDGGIHRAWIYVNDHTVPELDAGSPVEGDYLWREQEYIEVTTGTENPFHAHYLAEANELMLLVPGDTPAGSDNRVLLDYYEITYQRDLIAREDELLITLDPADGVPTGEIVDFRVEGFQREDIRVYRSDGSLLTNAEIRPAGEGYFRCHFQDELTGPVYYRVLTTERLQTVDCITRVDPLPTFSYSPATLDCDYLVIVPDSLLTHGNSDSLQLWLEQHPGEFDPFRVLPASRVYDWFSQGRFSPYAIRDLLQYGLHYWERFPRYLLLAGDGSDEQRIVAATGQPLLPVQFRFATDWGATVTEHWFGQLTADQIPDVLVGRLPASSAEELSAMLAKLLTYQAAAGGAWQNRLLFVSGIGGVGELTFEEQTATLIQNWISPRYFVERLETNNIFSPFFGGTEQLLTYLDNGVALASYNGHGGGAIWSDNNLFRDEDVLRLQNGQTLPFITNFTCYINAFESGVTLGEQLLTAPEQGAIGTLGCSALSFFLSGNELAQYFYYSLLNQPRQPVGEAMFNAVITFHSLYAEELAEPTEQGAIIRSLLNSMNILGDPAQHLHLPQPAPTPVLSPAAGWPGESLQGGWSTVTTSQQGLAKFYNNVSQPLLRGASPLYHAAEDELLPLGEGDFELASVFPDSCPGGTPGQVRWLAFSDDPHDACNALTPFFYSDSLATPYLWGTGTVPAEVTTATPFTFAANCAAADSLLELAVDLTVLDTLAVPCDQFSELLLPDPDNPIHYQGTTEYGPYPAGFMLTYFFVTEDLDGNRDTTTTTWQEVLPLLPDARLTAVFTSPASGGGCRVLLTNAGNSAADDLPLRLSLSVDSVQWQTAAEITLPRLDADADTSVSLDLPVVNYGWLRFDLDPDSLVADGDRTNNRLILAATVRYYGVSSELGTHDGAAHAVIQLDTQTRLEILPEEMPPGLSGVLEVEEQGAALPQPDLTLATVLYRVEGIDLPETVPLHWTWVLPADSAQVSSHALADRWQSGWLRCEELTQETSADSVQLTAITSTICGAVPGDAIDDDRPRLEVSVENQVLTDGGFVSREPTFTVYMSDRNGIDPDGLTALIDGTPLDPAAIHLDSGNDLAALGVALKPDLTGLHPDSLHTLVVGAQDLCGNRDSLVTRFRIASDLAIEYFGNYPNPFAEETLFIFNLTDLTDRIELDIFTPAGRRIRRLTRQGPLINYAEIHWNGRDEYYRAVANGVYFYRITAWQGENKVTCTGKAARIR